MAILLDENTRVLVQGITGKSGIYHATQMFMDGTQIVGGVSPGKGGEWIHSIPVFDTVKTAVNITGANTSVIFVPPPNTADAIHEAIHAEIELIVCITEGVPVQDTMQIYHVIKHSNTRLVGPNCPGILVPGVANIGIMPNEVTTPGPIGVVSRSGTLIYEVAAILSEAQAGQSTLVGVGGDPIVGTSITEMLEMFEADPETEKIVVVGEIGGTSELEAAAYIGTRMTKPVVAYIAGLTAPYNVRMGHAGAIIQETGSSAQEKIDALLSAGARVAEHPEQIPFLLN